MTKEAKGVRPLTDKTESHRGLTPGLTPDQVLDCYGLVCPVPVRKTAERMDQLRAGQVLQVIATDDWFEPDLIAWLRRHPYPLLKLERVGPEIHAYLGKR